MIPFLFHCFRVECIVQNYNHLPHTPLDDGENLRNWGGNPCEIHVNSAGIRPLRDLSLGMLKGPCEKSEANQII